jgi:hypothetical protein
MIKPLFRLFVVLGALCLHGSAFAASAPKVVAFYTVDVESDHIHFAQDALKFFAAHAKQDGYDFVSTGATINNSFAKITFSSVVTDTAAGFSSSTNLYTIPVSGTYMIVTKLRGSDSQTSGASYGQGANLTAVDGSWFSWFVTAPDRNGSINTRVVHLTAGTTVQMYAYADSGLVCSGGEMDIVLLSTP